MQTGAATMENSIQVPKKPKTELPYDPATPLLGIYQDRTIIQKDACTPLFTAALFTTAKTCTQLKCSSTDEQIKMWYKYTYNGILPSH